MGAISPGANTGADLSGVSDSPTDEQIEESTVDTAVDDVEESSDNQANNSEEITDNSDDTSEDEDATKQPFHKHPRWIEREKRIKALEEENQRLRTASSEKQTDKQDNSNSQNLVSANTDIDKVFEGLPEREFKEKYGSYKEFYKDLRKAIVADLVDVRSVQTTAESKLVDEYTRRLDDFRAEVGDDEFAQFTEFADRSLKVDPTFTFEQLITFWKDPTRKPQASDVTDDESAPKKPKNRVSTKTRPSGNSGEGSPTRDYLRSKSMHEIMEEQMQRLSK